MCVSLLAVDGLAWCGVKVLRQLRGAHDRSVSCGDGPAAGDDGRHDLPRRVQSPALLQFLPQPALPRMSLRRTSACPRRDERLSHPRHQVSHWHLSCEAA